MQYDVLRYHAIARISGPILMSLACRNMARAAALLMGFHVETQQHATGPDQVSIVYLPKAGHTEDVMACFKGHARYTIHTLDRKLVKAVFNAFLPVEMDDNNYQSTDPAVEHQKKRLRDFWIQVLKYLQPAVGFDAMFSGNFSYAAEQELAGACTCKGIPFIALHKECMKTSGLWPFFIDVYTTRKNQFQGAKVCSYNHNEAGIQKQARISAPENLLVTGLPRLDRLHELRKQGKADTLSPDEPVVLSFAINTKAGLPMIGRKIPGSFETLPEHLERLNTEKLAQDNYIAMLELARDNPSIRVVIKTKGDVNSDRMLRYFYGDNPDFPPNLEIMAGGDLLEIMKKATVVTSFNSTALFEAMALNKPVVVPWFHEATDPELLPYFIDMEDAVSYASSKEEYVRMLKDMALEPERPESESVLPHNVAGLLEKWCGNSDGMAGRRVRDLLDSLLDK